MSEARLEEVHADRLRAGEFLVQAEGFLDDADVPALRAESRVVLLHNAAISACDAILQAVGLRVMVGDRAHMVRIETALEQLSDDTEELLERLDASRERRNEASYAAGFIAQASLDDAREATTELVALARGFVRT